MKEKLLSKSKRSTFNTIIILLGIALFSFFIYLIYSNYQPKVIYEEHIRIFGMVGLSVFVLYLIFYLLNTTKIYVYENYFEIRNLFKSERHFFSEFKTYYSEHFNGKYNSWTEYYLIKKDNEKITLTDEAYSNFHVFFYEIKRKIPLNKTLNDEITKPKFLKYAFICLIISVLLFYWSSFFYNFQPESNTDFVYVTDVLKENIKTKSGTKGSKTMIIQLENYPIFDFKVGGYHDYLNNEYSIGDSITLGIEKEVFEKKITKTQPLTFKDKYWNFTSIFVEQIITKNGDYFFNIEDANNLRKNNYLGGIILPSLFGLLFLIFAAGNYNAYRKSKKNP